MAPLQGLPYSVLVVHSRKWSKTLTSEYRTQVKKILDQVEIVLRKQHVGFSITPVFFPQDTAQPDSNRHDVLRIIRDASYAIIDLTDYDEELASIAGFLAGSGLKALSLVSGSSSALLEGGWPFDARPVRYNSLEELQRTAEIVCTDFAQILMSKPLPAQFIRMLWFPRDVSSIWIVCPQIEEPGEFAYPSSPDYTYLDNLGDTDALLEVMVFLSRYYPSASIEKFSSRDLPIGLTKGNLVVIGGPGTPDTISNHLSRSMMDAMQSSVSYSEDCESMFVTLQGGRRLELKAKLNEPSAEQTNPNERFTVVTDYGYFARFRNPANQANHVVCLNGIHTIGVLGAARAFGDRSEALHNYHTVLKDQKEILEFESYFEVSVLNGDVLVPHIREDSVFRFDRLQVVAQTSTVDEKTKVGEDAIQQEPPETQRTFHSKAPVQEQTGALRLVRVLARQIAKSNGELFRNASGLFLLHTLPDLIPFLDAFESLGLQPSQSVLYYKRYPYYQKQQTLELLAKRGYRIQPMEDIDKTLQTFLHQLDPRRKVFVLEDGGYIGPTLHKWPDSPWDMLAGAVEQTERGVRMYEQISPLRIPVAPVARSGLKDRQEPPHVGRTIVQNISRLLPNRNLAGMHCLVIGYGRIGEAVCEAARSHRMIVSVFDSDRGALSKAAQASYQTGVDLRSLLKDTQIVIGTTGNQSLSREHILSLQHGTILVSGSSGQYEIGIEALEMFSHKRQVKENGTEYTLEKDDRVVLLLGDGYPINFFGADSIPEEAIDPVLSALFVTTASLLLEPPANNGIQLDWTNKVIGKYELEKIFFDLYFSR